MKKEERMEQTQTQEPTQTVLVHWLIIQTENLMFGLQQISHYYRMLIPLVPVIVFDMFWLACLFSDKAHMNQFNAINDVSERFTDISHFSLTSGQCAGADICLKLCQSFLWKMVFQSRAVCQSRQRFRNSFLFTVSLLLWGDSFWSGGMNLQQEAKHFSSFTHCRSKSEQHKRTRSFNDSIL